MPTQTAASRGYVLFRGAIRDTHKSPTNCLPECEHDPRSAPNLERHGSSKMQTSGWLEMPHFLNRISICISSEIPRCGFLIILLINPKNDMLIAAIPFCLLYYSSSPRKISLRSTSSASSFPSALACSSGYFDPVRSISITDA